MLGDKTVPQLADSILSFLIPFLGAQAGVLYKDENKIFHQAAQLGVPADIAIPKRFAVSDELLGRVAADGQSIVLHDVPKVI